MATLTLTETWVNLVATGEAVHAQSDPDRQREYSVAGEVRTYGAGRQRAVSVEGERGSFAFTLVGLSDDQITTLRSWATQLVQVRDHRGRRFYGAYFAVAVGEPRALWTGAVLNGPYTAGLSVQFTTYSPEGS